MRQCARWSDREGSSWRDLPGDGLAASVAADPAADDLGEEPGAAARVDEQEPAGVELGHDRVVEVLRQPLGDAARAAHKLAAAQLQARAQLVEQPGAAPARLSEDASVIGADNEDGVERHRELGVAHAAQREREGGGKRLRRAALLIDDAAGAFAGEERDGVLAFGETALDRERLPRRAFLVLGKAERQLARAAVRGAIDLAGAPAADVADDELQRAADGEPRAVALPEHVDARVHADGAPDGPVDDDHRPHGHGGREYAVHVELIGAG